MRWSEIINESKKDKNSEINKLSPLTITPKTFIFSRATGPLGARTVDGFIKDKFRDKLELEGEPKLEIDVSGLESS